MPPAINTPFYLDKALWVAILGFLLPILNKKLGLDLSPDAIYGALSPLIGFIVMTKWKSTTLTKAAIAAGQEVTNTPTKADPAAPAGTPTPAAEKLNQ